MTKHFNFLADTSQMAFPQWFCINPRYSVRVVVYFLERLISFIYILQRIENPQHPCKMFQWYLHWRTLIWICLASVSNHWLFLYPLNQLKKHLPSDISSPSRNLYIMIQLPLYLLLNKWNRISFFSTSLLLNLWL